MTSPVADTSAPPYSAAGGAGMSRDHSYSVANPWNGDGYSDSPIQAYASPPSVDPDRLDNRTRVDSRANLRDVFGWWRRKDADTAKRESVTSEVSTGWAERVNAPNAVVDRPKPSDTGNPRPTSSQGPNTYFFERPFDATMERQFNGAHFSMADHKRTFEIYGMAAPVRARNTYRIEPGPTDRDITDMPSDDNYVPQYAVTNDVPVSGIERSWRL